MHLVSSLFETLNPLTNNSEMRPHWDWWLITTGDYPQMTLFQVSEILYFTQIQWFCLKLCCFPNQRPNISPLKCAAHVAGEIEGLIGWLSGVVSRLLDPRGRYQWWCQLHRDVANNGANLKAYLHLWRNQQIRLIWIYGVSESDSACILLPSVRRNQLK